MIKLIAIDLDGTLLNDQKKISQQNIDTLKKAKAQGVKIVICTGRPLVSIHGFIETLGLNEVGDYSITFNGGLVQKNDTGESLAEFLVSVSQVKEVYQEMTRLGLPIDVVSDDTVIHLKPNPQGYPSIYQQLNPLLKFVDQTPAALSEEVRYNKMVVPVEANYLDQRIPLIAPHFLEEFTVVKSRDCLLEILNKKVSKAKGIALLGQHLGITQEEVMAIGDEDNDLSMVEYAGIGVAMANGSERVKQAAQFITTSNQEDGVAHAIKEYVLTKEG